MDEPWGHYTKWDTSVTKRQTLLRVRSSDTSRVVKFIETGSTCGCQGFRGEGNEEFLFNGYRVCFVRWKDSSD